MEEQQEKDFVTEITRKSENFSQWYIDVVRKAELADYTIIKGCMVIKPYGYALWENIKELLDKRIKATGHKNAYFPLFVPESLLAKEAEHVAGFAPEVAWVTHGGNEKLEERMAIRPTSEAIICSIYSKWVKSYRDLPLLINQWANVVRWEKVTRLFLRTTEFLWQEGHTVHRTMEEAEEEALKMLFVYRDFLKEDLAIPVYYGAKSESERFAGALKTYTVEALMGDGKALQAGTSHNLGQHFAKVFDIKYLDADGVEKYAWQTSWGVSTRLVGAVVMVHGDDYGLKFPPKIAPTQVIIVPILYEKTKDEVLKKAKGLKDILQGHFRLEIDDRDEYTPGWKFNEWEMRGVPIRLELGPRDLKGNKAILVRRDTREKITVDQNELVEIIGKLLEDIQQNMYQSALEYLKTNTREATDIEEFKKIMETTRGFIRAGWCGSRECEERIKTEYKATIRCIPLENSPENMPCVNCGKSPATAVYFAQAY